MENKLKYLEFILRIIERMADNSAQLKRWTIMLVIGTILYISSTTISFCLIIIVIPFFALMLLDAYYLMKEKMFRKLYSDVCKMSEKEIDFSMSVDKYLTTPYKNFISALFSLTILTFYAPIILTIIGLYYF